MKTIVWLASYPKSGNTWVRWLLANLVCPDKGSVPVNALPDSYGQLGPLLTPQARWFIDRALGFYTSDLWPHELAYWRLYGFRKALMSLSDVSCLIKVHELRKAGLGDDDLLFKGACHKVIHIVRDPRDVVLSYARFAGESANTALDWLLDDEHMLPEYNFAASEAIRVKVGSWRANFRAWHDPGNQAYLLIRYEDLVSDTVAALTRIATHLTLEVSDSDILRAVENTSFDAAALEESVAGFVESMSKDRTFFSKGTSGYWREELDYGLAQKLSNDLRDELIALNYSA